MPKPKDIEEAVDAVVGAMTLEELVDQTEPPKPTPEPDPTPQQIRDIVEKLQNPGENGGHLGIARAVNVSVKTVLIVKRAVQARVDELTPDVEPDPQPVIG